MKLIKFFSIFILLFSNIVGAQTAFPPGNNDMYLSLHTDNSGTNLYRYNNLTNPVALEQIGSMTATNIKLNAMGYNPVDNFIYAINTVNNHLFRIGQNFVVADLGAISGYPTAANGKTVTGDIDNLGKYYLKPSLGPSNTGYDFYTINLNTNPYLATKTELRLDTTGFVNDIGSADFAFNIIDGFLYGVDSKNSNNAKLYKINPATSRITYIGLVGTGIGQTGFGSMFSDGVTGAIYGNSNAQNNAQSYFYQFDTDVNSPTAGKATPISKSFTASGNDGAHNATTSIPFGVDVAISITDNKINYVPGTNNTYKVIVTNNGPYTANNATVNIPVPSSITGVVSYTAVASGNSSTSVVGTQTGAINDVVKIGFDSTTDFITYTIVVPVPANLTSNLVYNATVNASAADVDLNISNNSASDTDRLGNDNDGDGIPDVSDLDDDNDGILDTAECNAIQRVKSFDFNNNGNSVTTANVKDWNLSNGVVFSSSNDFIQFITDNTTQSLNQSVNNISWSGESPVVNLQLSVRNATGNTVSSSASLTISYAGTIYATLTTANNNGPATFVANNGASLSGTIPTYNNTDPIVPFVTQALTLPPTVPASGNFVITYVAGAGLRDDINLNLFNVESCKDTDGDGIPDYFDVDSDGDGCADAVEGSELVYNSQIYPLTLAPSDANYELRGQIKVIYDGSTVNTPANIISNSPSSLGVPQLVNIAGSNLNTITNPSNLKGIADNTDTPPTAEVGQGIGASQNAAVNGCVCRKPMTTGTPNSFTKIGISTQSTKVAVFPETVPNGFIALESTNKGFVITRTTTAKIVDPKMGMIIYDTTNNCVSLYNGSSWKCIAQSCNE